jgi:predicted nucleic acid-binding protein
LLCLGLGVLEVVSVLVRKKNSGQMSPAAFAQALTTLQTETVDGGFPILASDPHIDAALPLVDKYSLNANDALVLRVAMNHAAQIRPLGYDVVLVASDKRLLKASQAEGLVTFDPETQSDAELNALLPP